MAKIKIPAFGWKPRPDQLPAWQFLQSGGKRAFVLAHRRWGKDEIALHFTATQAIQRVGNYWHCLPEYGQARKAIWEAINPHTGRRRIDEAFPADIREATRTQDMMIKFKNGSTWQLVGSDNYNALVGSPPVGLVFSEYALADPRAWNFMRPILAENNGHALFITTPRGNNHAKSLFEYAQEDDAWFAQKITVDESGVFSPEMLAQERRELIAQYGPDEGEAIFRQEYYCSFDGAVIGSYYGPLIEMAQQEGRIGNVPYDPAIRVTTAWDLGVGDATGIWFLQIVGREIRVIDYYEASGEGLAYYAKILDKKPYVYEEHIMPHDIRVRELGTGKSRLETAQQLGIKPIKICRQLPVDDGINAVRQILPRCYFDKNKCSQGLEALRAYHKEYDDKRREFKNKPYHDWTSHGSDAFRMFAVGHAEKASVRSVSHTFSNMLRGGFGI